jgi:hypothetical protein
MTFNQSKACLRGGRSNLPPAGALPFRDHTAAQPDGGCFVGADEGIPCPTAPARPPANDNPVCHAERSVAK